MLENTQLLPKQKAIIVSVINLHIIGHSDLYQTTKSVNEMQELLYTLDINVVDKIVQNKPQLQAATLLGLGKWEEIKIQATEKMADLIVFDGELTGAQIKNISKLTSIQVVDRTYIILEIFSQHARTKVAKLQMNIARLEYLLPRLTTLWGHLSRQKGGIGVRGGEGEQQLELDRRLVRSRVELLKAQLDKAQIAQNQKKKKRSQFVSTAALVGYTNAGKSSIMNALTHSQVLVEDKLFATLDSTCKALNPNSHPPMVMVDTVGLISQLPASLFEGFRTTLESAMDAELLVIVTDISSEDVSEHLQTTIDTLKELNVENKKKLFVFNKKDKMEGNQQWKMLKYQFRPNILVSSNDKNDMDLLRKMILDTFLQEQGKFDLFIPYEFGQGHSTVKSSTNIIREHAHTKGIFYRIRIPRHLFPQLHLQDFLLSS